MDYAVIDTKFLQLFDGGIHGDKWIELGKKHNSDKITEIIRNELNREIMAEMISCQDYEKISAIALKIIKKSSIVSVFEKVAFQNFIGIKDTNEQFSISLYKLLHDFNKESFENMADVLSIYKQDKKLNVAKWPIISAFNVYKDSSNYVFIKPNTVKQISKWLEYDIEYSPSLNFKTYDNVRKMITDYRDNSYVCKNENLMIAQAVLFCVTSMS